MAITRHLVFDPATGHLVRDPDTGHLVYGAIATADAAVTRAKTGLDLQSNAAAPYPAESTVMANAVSAMQSCAWNSYTGPTRETKKFWDGRANTQCIAMCRFVAYDTSALNGESITGVIVPILNPYLSYSAETYRLKLATSASSSPATAWADIYNSPQYQGTGNGAVPVPFAVTLNDYLLVYLCADDYSAPAVADPGFGSASLTYYARFALSGDNVLRCVIVE